MGGQGYASNGADATALTGYIAVYSKGADDPKTPATTSDRGHVLIVKLARQDGKLAALSGELRPRDSIPGNDIPRELTAAPDEVDYDI